MSGVARGGVAEESGEPRVAVHLPEAIGAVYMKPMLKKRTQTALPALAAGMPSAEPALVSLALMEMPRLGRLERMPAETAMSNPVSKLVGAFDAKKSVRGRGGGAGANNDAGDGEECAEKIDEAAGRDRADERVRTG